MTLCRGLKSLELFMNGYEIVKPDGTILIVWGSPSQVARRRKMEFLEEAEVPQVDVVAREVVPPVQAISADSESVGSEFLIGNDPTTALTGVSLTELKVKYKLPSDGVALPLPSQRPYHDIEGKVVLYEVAFRLGLRIPLSPFVRGVLEVYGLAPGQLVPNAWRILLGLEKLGQLKDIDVSTEVLHCAYRPKGSPKEDKGRVMFATRTGGDQLVILKQKSEDSSWKGRYFLVDRSLVFGPTHAGTACSSWKHYGKFLSSSLYYLLIDMTLTSRFVTDSEEISVFVEPFHESVVSQILQMPTLERSWPLKTTGAAILGKRVVGSSSAKPGDVISCVEKSEVGK